MLLISANLVELEHFELFCFAAVIHLYLLVITLLLLTLLVVYELYFVCCGQSSIASHTQLIIVIPNILFVNMCYSTSECCNTAA